MEKSKWLRSPVIRTSKIMDELQEMVYTLNLTKEKAGILWKVIIGTPLEDEIRSLTTTELIKKWIDDNKAAAMFVLAGILVDEIKLTDPIVEKNLNLVTCKNCGKEFDYVSIPESGMGYVRCPSCNMTIDQEGNDFQEKVETSIDKVIEKPIEIVKVITDEVIPHPIEAPI